MSSGLFLMIFSHANLPVAAAVADACRRERDRVKRERYREVPCLPEEKGLRFSRLLELAKVYHSIGNRVSSPAIARGAAYGGRLRSGSGSEAGGNIWRNNFMHEIFASRLISQLQVQTKKQKTDKKDKCSLGNTQWWVTISGNRAKGCVGVYLCLCGKGRSKGKNGCNSVCMSMTS